MMVKRCSETTTSSTSSQSYAAKTSKRQKIGTAASADEDDRISDLPDLLLSHILSFLPTKDAVATSLLSTRWEFVWTQVPNFDFDFNDEHLRERWRLERYAFNFAPLVNNFLLLSAATSINKFRLSCSRFDFGCGKTDCDQTDGLLTVSAWIGAVISREVKHLDLCLYNFCDHSTGVKLPRSLFFSKTLVSLKLESQVFINVLPVNRRQGCFQCLKTLHLIQVKYQNDEAARSLISSCSVLENLTVQRNLNDNVVVYTISAPALKQLVYNPIFARGSQYPPKLEINAPALIYLELRSMDLPVGQNLSCLVEARLRVDMNGSRGFDEDLYRADLIRFLKSLPNVKFLWLLDDALSRVLVPGRNPSIKFQNLTKLSMGCYQRRDLNWSALEAALHFAENLETLSVFGFVNCWSEPEELPKCLSSCLAAISFSSFRGAEGEVDMVKYFLKNALVLKSMDIGRLGGHAVNVEEEKYNSALEEISKFPRASRACEILRSNTTSKPIFWTHKMLE